MTNFENRTVLITGAGTGIGEACARHFGGLGANLVLMDVKPDGIGALAEAFPGRALALTGDVADEASMREVAAKAIDRFGSIEVGVLNAGIGGTVAPFGELSAADFDRVIAVNLRGVFLGLTVLMPHMRARRQGAITILSSTAGVRGNPGFGAYVASKHAVIGLMRVAALEGAADNVRVNTVNPAPIETQMMRHLEAEVNPDEPEAMRSRFASGIPMRRYGTPQEIANLIGFLSSDEASFCTGGVYMADGGTMAGTAR